MVVQVGTTYNPLGTPLVIHHSNNSSSVVVSVNPRQKCILANVLEFLSVFILMPEKEEIRVVLAATGLRCASPIHDL